VVLDELHGRRIEDPYRWLEDAASEETSEWVDQQNAYTRSLLDAVPGRAAIHQRLSQLLSIGLVSAPQVCHGRYFYVRREGRQNQPVLYLRIAAGYLQRATSSIRIFAADGTHRGDVALPALGTAAAVTGEWEQPDGFFTFESFTLPPTVYRFSVDTGTTTAWASVDAQLDSDDFTVRQEWYPSRDGTPVSMFLVHRTDLDRSQPLPTLLSGYGGFNISRTPLFSRSMYLWLEQGGMYALPNLRGGGEYGEAWHRAGMLDQKQNVFDDFIGAAEYLIEQGYTDPAHLAIQGGSNGGLLVGAALTQRPDLFRAVVCAVPLLDMLRYHHFLIARLWIPEYGSADDPTQFPFLHAYSPYHHVQPETQYPAVLLTTAESDSRVDPLHARKMAALLQAATASHHPVLLRVETRAGHGIGKPLGKVIEEQTDMWSFLLWQLGVTIQ